MNNNNNNNSTYTVYRNDIKYKNLNQINPNQAEWDGCTEKDFEQDTNSIEYRISECKRERYHMLDLSNMNYAHIDRLRTSPEYPDITRNVRHLFLSGSIISHDELHILLKGFVQLETLEINNISLTVLPPMPSQLQELNVENNLLHNIDRKMPNLKRLFCKNNRLEMLDISTSPALERLECQNNPMKYIRTADNRLNNLYFLDISMTKIDRLNDMKSLKYLYCSGSCVQTIPYLPVLKILAANNCPLDDITKLCSVESIELINTPVVSIHYIKSLKELVFEKAKKISLSEQYKVDHMQENRNEICKLRFAEN